MNQSDNQWYASLLADLVTHQSTTAAHLRQLAAIVRDGAAVLERTAQLVLTLADSVPGAVDAAANLGAAATGHDLNNLTMLLRDHSDRLAALERHLQAQDVRLAEVLTMLQERD